MAARLPYSALTLPFVRGVPRDDDVMRGWGAWLAAAIKPRLRQQCLYPDDEHCLVGPMPVGWELDSELLRRICILDTGPLWPRRLDEYRAWYTMGGTDPEGDDLLRALVQECRLQRTTGIMPTLNRFFRGQSRDEFFVMLRPVAEIRRLLSWPGDPSRGRRAAEVFQRLLVAEDDLPAAIVEAYLRPDDDLIEMRSCGDRGKGLFARVPIPKGTVILPAYGGVILQESNSQKEMQAMHEQVTVRDRERVKADAELFDLDFSAVAYTGMKQSSAGEEEEDEEEEDEEDGSVARSAHGAAAALPAMPPPSKRARLDGDQGAAGSSSTHGRRRGAIVISDDDESEEGPVVQPVASRGNRARARGGGAAPSSSSSSSSSAEPAADGEGGEGTTLRASVLAMYDINLAFKTRSKVGQPETSYDLLAWRLHNIMAYINDYHGVEDALTGKPYAAPNVLWEDAILGGIYPLVFVRACRDIKQGQELVVDYGPNYVRYWEHRKPQPGDPVQPPKKG